MAPKPPKEALEIELASGLPGVGTTALMEISLLKRSQQPCYSSCPTWPSPTSWLSRRCSSASLTPLPTFQGIQKLEKCQTVATRSNFICNILQYPMIAIDMLLTKACKNTHKLSPCNILQKDRNVLNKQPFQHLIDAQNLSSILLRNDAPPPPQQKRRRRRMSKSNKTWQAFLRSVFTAGALQLRSLATGSLSDVWHFEFGALPRGLDLLAAAVASVAQVAKVAKVAKAAAE